MPEAEAVQSKSKLLPRTVLVQKSLDRISEVDQEVYEMS